MSRNTSNPPTSLPSHEGNGSKETLGKTGNINNETVKTECKPMSSDTNHPSSDHERKKQKKAESARKRYQALTPEAKQAYLAKKNAPLREKAKSKKDFINGTNTISVQEKKRLVRLIEFSKIAKGINETPEEWEKRLQELRDLLPILPPVVRKRNNQREAELAQKRYAAKTPEQKRAINDKRKASRGEEKADKASGKVKLVTKTGRPIKPSKPMSVEEKKARGHKNSLRTLAKRLNETPEEREVRLRKNRESRVAYRLSMTPEECLKYRERVRKWTATTMERRVLQLGPDSYSTWSEERKEKMRAYQREKFKRETPEQRQKRLDRFKRNQKRRKEINQIMETESITKPEAEVMLQISRPELFPESYYSPNTGKQRYSVDQPYVPILLDNSARARRPGAPKKVQREEVLEFIAQRDAKRRRSKAASAVTSQPNNEGETKIAADNNPIKTTLIPSDSLTPQETKCITPQALITVIQDIKEESETLENTLSINSPKEIPPRSPSPISLDFPVEEVADIPSPASPASPPPLDVNCTETNVSSTCTDNPNSLSPVTKTVQKYNRGKKTYSCDSCGKIYSNNCDLKGHIDSVHTITPEQFSCPQPLCTSVFSSSFLLWKHYRLCHRGSMKNVEPPKIAPKEIYTSSQCQFCGKSFFSWANLKRHVKSVHTIEAGIDETSPNFFCDQCPKIFKAKCTLDDHVRRIHMGLDNKCDICGRTFQSGVKLWRHKKDKHKMTDLEPSSIPSIQLQKCPYCSEHIFRRLDKHVRSVHPENVDEFMSKGGKRLRKNFSLEQLRNERTKDGRRGQCEICHKMVILRTMKKHVQSMHSEHDKQVTCERCSKNFFNVDLLVRHIISAHWVFLPDSELIKPISLSNSSVYPDSHNCSYCNTPVRDHFLFKLHLITEHTAEILHQFSQAVKDPMKLKRKRKQSQAKRVRRKPKDHLYDSRLKGKTKVVKIIQINSNTNQSRSSAHNQSVRKSSRIRTRTRRFNPDNNVNSKIRDEKRVNEISALMSAADRKIVRKYSNLQLNQIPIVTLINLT